MKKGEAEATPSYRESRTANANEKNFSIEPLAKFQRPCEDS
jgi:hypothetical protein